MGERMKKRGSKSKQSLVYTTIFLLAFGVGASAEDSSLYTLEDMLVTAMKREQNILDAPVAVQNFAGDLVEVMHLSNAFDLADQIPGAYASKPSQPTVGEIFIRGAGSTSFQAGGAKGDRTTGVYVDDTPMVYPNHQRLPPVPMFDLERVEVLRGPQGTTYGAGSMGGTIKYVTRSPDLDSFNGKLQLTASETTGAHGLNNRVDAVVNIPVVKDRFAVRIFVQDEQKAAIADVRDRPDIDDADDFDSRSFRVKALLQVTDTLTVEAAHWESEFEQWRFRSYDTTDPITFGAFDDSFPRNDSVFEQSTLTINWELPSATLISNTQWIGDDQEIGPTNRAKDFMTVGKLTFDHLPARERASPAGASRASSTWIPATWCTGGPKNSVSSRPAQHCFSGSWAYRFWTWTRTARKSGTCTASLKPSSPTTK